MSATKRRERKAAAILRDQHPDTAIIADLRATVERLTKEKHDAESLLASATDLLNTWARESNVAEAHDERSIKQVIDRLWATYSNSHHCGLERIAALEASNAELQAENGHLSSLYMCAETITPEGELGITPETVRRELKRLAGVSPK